MYKEKKIIISIVCEGTEWQPYQDYRLFSFLFLKIIFSKGLMQSKKFYVRSGIWTHAFYRRPEYYFIGIIRQAVGLSLAP